MRCSSLFLAAAMLVPTGAAMAECPVCDDVIELTSFRAACFIENHETIVQAVAAAPNGRMPIDLDACMVGGDKLETRGALADMPTLEGVLPEASDRTAPIKSVYLLDLASVECLKDLIEAHSGPFDPVATFDLFGRCQS